MRTMLTALILLAGTSFTFAQTADDKKPAATADDKKAPTRVEQLADLQKAMSKETKSFTTPISRKKTRRRRARFRKQGMPCRKSTPPSS